MNSFSNIRKYIFKEPEFIDKIKEKNEN